MGKLISCVGNIKTKKRCGNGEEYWDNIDQCQDKYRIGENMEKDMLYLINSMRCFFPVRVFQILSQYMKVYHTWNHISVHMSYALSWKIQDFDREANAKKSVPSPGMPGAPKRDVNVVEKITWILYIYIVAILTIVTIVPRESSFMCVCVPPIYTINHIEFSH